MREGREVGGGRKELTKDDILRLLARTNDVLAKRGHQAIIYVVGGANISLTLDARRITTDVDVVVKRGQALVASAAAEVARLEGDLADDWLNSAFSNDSYDSGITWSWFDNKDTDLPFVLYAGKALSVELASPEMILALKTLAARDKDMDDIILLMRHTGIISRKQIGDNLRRFTGERIFATQNHWSNPIHIYERMSDIFDALPPDLKASWGDGRYDKKLARMDRKNRRILEKARGKERAAVSRALRPVCGHYTVHFRDGIEVSRTAGCVRAKGHLGPHKR